jgi:hypothetical protein
MADPPSRRWRTSLSSARAVALLPALCLMVLCPGLLLADEVRLRGGGSISGVIVERNETEIKVDIGAGRMTVKMSTVLEIVEGSSPLSEYRQRAAALAPGDVEGWRTLGRWASEQGLRAQAREAYGKVLALAPDDGEANQAMGRVLWDGRWISEEEAYRAQGLVEYQGEWMTPDERQLLADDEAAREQAESQAVDQHIADVTAAHDARKAADEAYWADAQDSWSVDEGMVYWDVGVGPQLVPDVPGSWP